MTYTGGTGRSGASGGSSGKELSSTLGKNFNQVEAEAEYWFEK
jgi:hypothetical protein